VNEWFEAQLAAQQQVLDQMLKVLDAGDRSVPPGDALLRAQEAAAEAARANTKAAAAWMALWTSPW
jgi:hypothetical protein